MWDDKVRPLPSSWGNELAKEVSHATLLGTLPCVILRVLSLQMWTIVQSEVPRENSCTDACCNSVSVEQSKSEWKWSKDTRSTTQTKRISLSPTSPVIRTDGCLVLGSECVLPRPTFVPPVHCDLTQLNKQIGLSQQAAPDCELWRGACA